ncbi:hypothetical protein Ahy_B05g075001 [Arachis hypogaea]|uniref:Reverse transcriptase zinc-binding domain-containing protein n=1 Tax=Arachis hypogaea TaxID=3818 RepID=A0A444Z076_ARAHY|nr:hypothetical protein Ahy_B05g075001 [Arachis hypogaea]
MKLKESSHDFKVPNSTGPWKDIINGVKQIAPLETIVGHGVRMSVGNGSKTKFWEDKWLGDFSLRDKFPILFVVSSNKNEVITNCGFWDGLLWNWNLRWRRCLFEWERKHCEELHSCLQNVFLNAGTEDKAVWTFTTDGSFTIKSMINAVEGETLGFAESKHFFDNIWRGAVPPRVEMMAWFAILGRLNTKKRQKHSKREEFSGLNQQS